MIRTRLTWVVVGAVVALFGIAGLDALRSSDGYRTASAPTASTTTTGGSTTTPVTEEPPVTEQPPVEEAPPGSEVPPAPEPPGSEVPPAPVPPGSEVPPAPEPTLESPPPCGLLPGGSCVLRRACHLASRARFHDRVAELTARTLSLTCSARELAFWWLHARRGSPAATRPRSYAFADRVRLRLPLAFFNTGAKALIVSDLRLVIADEPERVPLGWITTRTKLRAESDDGFAFATPFSVQGRGTKELIAEFGDNLGWEPAPGSRHRLQLQAQVHPSEEWDEIAAFDWWAPPSADLMKQYVAHRNEPAEESEVPGGVREGS
jgi:hypothetical protein